MKALIVTRVSGFLPQFESNNVKILQEMGFEVHYAANFNTVVYGKDNHRLDGMGVIRHQIDFERSPFSPGVRKAYCQLKQLMEQESFDLIHCHMPMSGVVARMAAQAVRKETGRKVPVLYTAHGLHFYTGAPLKNWIYYPVERYLARFTDRLILINEEDYKRAQSFPVRGRVERIMGIGMKLDTLQSRIKTDYEVGRHVPSEEQDPAGDIYEKYDIPDHYGILISVGEITQRKNHIVMIDAMKELMDLPLVYLICGSGPWEEKLKAHVKEQGLESRVKFAGYVDQVPAVLQQADCFVFPSFQEGLPVAVMEAMAVGLPVIATRIRGITDLLEHTKGGYLADDWEPENYAVKVRRMFSERGGKSGVSREERRREMGTWNRRKVQEFALPVVDKKMREIYGSVMEEFDENITDTHVNL